MDIDTIVNHNQDLYNSPYAERFYRLYVNKANNYIK
jgi:hypothetical protein